MKGIIRTIILILSFALITVMAVSALNEDDIDVALGGISALSELQSELSTSTSTRSASRIIGSAIKQLNKAISNQGTSCVSLISSSLSRLDKLVSTLSNRSCTVSRRKNCIQGDLLDEILSDLQDAIDVIREITSIDENGNEIPDVCEGDPDGDGLSGRQDNCPLVSNPEQKDVDSNGVGDACDLFFCCEDTSLPLDECPKKTIKTCSEEGGVVVGCLPPLKAGGTKGETSGPTSSAPVILNKVISNLKNFLNFGTGSTPSMVIINTGFFPFADSGAVLMGFSDFNCNDLNLIFTPPPGFPGGIIQIGPAANGFETGPRQILQINGQGGNDTITINNFPLIDPNSGQPFDPQMGDQLGLSLFTNDMVFVDSFFDIFVDLDFNGGCLPPLSTSSGGVGTSSGGTGTTSGGTTSGGTTLQDALGMSTVPTMQGGMAYMAGTYDCDDFAEDLGMELQGQGFNTTFTAIWTNGGMTGHAVTDVHTTSGGIVFVEPQNGMVIDLDENMDGMVGFSDGMHSMTFMANEGMSQVEVYMDKDSAAMAGVPVD